MSVALGCGRAEPVQGEHRTFISADIASDNNLKDGPCRVSRLVPRAAGNTQRDECPQAPTSDDKFLRGFFKANLQDFYSQGLVRSCVCLLLSFAQIICWRK